MRSYAFTGRLSSALVLNASSYLNLNGSGCSELTGCFVGSSLRFCRRPGRSRVGFCVGSGGCGPCLLGGSFAGFSSLSVDPFCLSARSGHADSGSAATRANTKIKRFEYLIFMMRYVLARLRFRIFFGDLHYLAARLVCTWGVPGTFLVLRIYFRFVARIIFVAWRQRISGLEVRCALVARAAHRATGR